jgi:hypothetical protein
MVCLHRIVLVHQQLVYPVCRYGEETYDCARARAHVCAHVYSVHFALIDVETRLCSGLKCLQWRSSLRFEREYITH